LEASQIATAREAIKEGSRLRRMRLGQDAPEFEYLRSNPEIRVALVPLTEAENEYSLKAAMQLPAEDNTQGLLYRDRWQQMCDLWQATREPHDIEKKVFESVEEMTTELEARDINYLSEAYMRMLDESTPLQDGVTDEQLEELKKAFVTIDWSVLSGKAWWHLKQCLSYLGQEPLKVKLPGSSSMASLTGRSDETTSTTPADQS
jgi:hypothetical protein